jgi:cobalt-zinc-cadmium efflux system outer membrane protein
MRPITGRGPCLVLAVLAGCAPAPHLDEPFVSAEIERRTGHAPATEAAPGECALPAGVSLADGLSEEEAVAVALWNNAAFLAALSDLGLARADLVQAGVFSNPVFGILFPVGQKELEFAAKLPIEALWLRPRRVAAARLDMDRVAESLVQNGLDLARDAKVAFADVEYARARAKLASDAAGLGEDIARIAAARLAAGDASELEASAARGDALLLAEDSWRAEREILLAEERLASILGLGLAGRLPALLEGRDPGSAPSPPEAAGLLEEAMVSRPDLRASDLAVEAAGERAGLARIEILQLAAVVDANGGPFEIGPGVELPVPILDWNQGGISRADAEVVRTLRRRAALREKVALEVKEAHIRYARSREEVERWRERILPELDLTVKRAERAYAAGETSLLLVLETSARLVAARSKAASAAAEFHRSRAELERSVGHRLVAAASPQGAPPERVP